MIKLYSDKELAQVYNTNSCTVGYREATMNANEGFYPMFFLIHKLGLGDYFICEAEGDKGYIRINYAEEALQDGQFVRCN